MKKFLSYIVMAGLAVLGVASCAQKEMVMFEPADGTAPVLTSYTMDDDGVYAEYTPGIFQMGFNEKIAPVHSLALVKVGSQAVSKTLVSKATADKITVTRAELCKALMTYGYAENDVVDLSLVVRASMQDQAKDNGLNGYLDSQAAIDIAGYEIWLPTGDPYARYTEKSPWTLVGSFNGWGSDPDVEMLTNGSLHLAKGVTLAKGDEVKFRKDGGWDVNFGYAEGVESYVLGEEFDVAQNGANIVIAEDGVYDLILDADGAKAKIIQSVAQQEDPYAAYTEVSPWSVIGSFNSWAGDEEMVTNGTLHVCKDITLAAGDEFKVRKDAGWDVNFGYADGVETYELGTAFELKQDGANIRVLEDGAYDIILDPEAATMKIIKTQAVSIDPYAAYTEESAWSVIGSFNSWADDYPMVTNGTLHVAKKIALAADDEWKFRFEGGWTVNFGYADGVDTYELGVDFALAQDGANIKVLEDGEYDFILDPENATARIIKSIAVDGGEQPEPGPGPEPEPVAVTGWNIIGLNGDWDNDVLATQNGNIWTAYITANDATEFKWRKDGGWDENYGGVLESYGVPFAAEAGGANIALPTSGLYKVVLDTDALTITVYDDFTVWSIIGDINEWAGDIDMVEADGKWVAEDVVLKGGWKIRLNHSWDNNRGGVFETLGVPFAVTDGGDNIDCGEGKFTVVYDPAAETITVSEGTVWSLIGDFNEWGADVDMTEADGKWVVEGVDLSGGWKIRKNHDWAENRGGTFAAYGEPFAVENNGANINCGDGKFNVVYDPSAETITVTTAVFGWSVIGVNGDWTKDYDMVETMPGIWMSAPITFENEGWKIRYNHDWAVNRGSVDLTAEGTFAQASQDGGNVPLAGTFRVVYNANNETIGTLVWGVVGSINGWGGDVPMNLASDGKWYSVPVTLTADDEIKIRKNSAWEENFGGAFAEAEAAFAAEAGGSNIKPGEGTFQVIYDPAAATLTLSKLYWGLVGEFNGWGGTPDVFMLPLGDGKWAAYGQAITGPWKVRQGSSWDVNRGGVFTEKGTAFEAVAGGDNISVAGETSFDVIYDAVAETITVL